jgi:alkylation response protein AidB-like acyl-CoA dehydrogenase
VARAALDAETEHRPPFWSDLVGLGWLGLAVSVDQGGEGYGLPELIVVLEQLGRTVVPGPFLPAALTALAVDRFGGGGVRDRFASRLATGERVGAVAFCGGVLDGGEDDGALVVSGELAPVPGAAVADLLVLPARTAAGEVWVVLDRDQAKVEGLASIDPTRRLARVTVPDTSVPTDRWFGPVGAAVGVRELAAVLLCAEAVGLMGWCVETAATYACEREQFGRVIGQFQAVKHRCADMLCGLEQARAAVWDAARGGEPVESALAATVAAALVPAAAFQSAKDAIQVLGGIGFTWEHDAHLYLRRAAATLQLLGGAAPWRARVAAQAISGVRRTLTVDLPPEAEPYRPVVRAFVESVQSAPSAEWNSRIADAGYLVPHWPEPWGLGADPLHQLVIDEEFARAGVRRAHLAVGMWALPTIIAHGSAAQQERFVGPTMRREVTWCQLFSEPGAGSDLAALTTRAERVEGGWRLTGQKVWTTLAHQADWGICLARTDPHAAKHDGITCFLVDMRSEGVDIRPLRELTGHELFNEVFLDAVFVSDDCVVGEVNQGWSAARTTLANERVSMGSGSSFGPGVEAVLALVGADDALRGDPVVADEVGALVATGQAVAVMGTRLTLLALSGADAGAEASVKKLVGVEHEQRVQEVGLGLLGPAGGVLEGDGAVWVAGFLGNRALSIAGGTSEIQRNVIAERLLGLPKDP